MVLQNNDQNRVMCGRARNILVIDEDVTEKKITDFLK
jgi:hypothetical protein